MCVLIKDWKKRSSTVKTSAEDSRTVQISCGGKKQREKKNKTMFDVDTSMKTPSKLHTYFHQILLNVPGRVMPNEEFRFLDSKEHSHRRSESSACDCYFDLVQNRKD